MNIEPIQANFAFLILFYEFNNISNQFKSTNYQQNISFNHMDQYGN